MTYAIAIQLLAATAFPAAANGLPAADSLGMGLCVGDAAGGSGEGGNHKHRHPAGLPCHLMSGCVSAACGTDAALGPVAGALDVPLRLVDLDLQPWSGSGGSGATYQPGNARAPPVS